MWVICWIINPPNLVALNNDSIYFAHEPAVWPGLSGDDSFYFTRYPLGQLKGWGLESSEISLIHVCGGWGHLSTENLTGDQPEHYTVPLHGLWASSQHGGWAPRVSIPNERKGQAESASPLMIWSQISHCDILLFIYAATKVHPISRKKI